MNLYSPWMLLLLLLLPFLGFVLIKRRRSAAVRFGSVANFKDCPVSWRIRLRGVLIVVRFVILALLIIAIARPRDKKVLSEISTEGVALEIVVDQSGSMQNTMDYYGEQARRIDVVKKVFAEFVEGDKKRLTGRSGDMMGLITFAQYAETSCPLVLGHQILVEFLKNTDIASGAEANATAVGDAIALAASRLSKAEEELEARRKLARGQADQEDNQSTEADYEIKSKAMILLTDGLSNSGDLNPIQAAELAKKWGVKIYAIGIGSNESYQTVQTAFGSYRIPVSNELDEATLKRIAEMTGGFYGKAGDVESLKKIVEKINELEKTEVKTIQYAQYTEKFNSWAFAALMLLLFEIIAGCTVFRKIP